METLGAFAYTISKTSSILVASMSGKINQSSLEKFQQFHDEILTESTIRFVLLDMSQLTGITLDGIPGLVNFQRALRSKGIEIKLCGMEDSLRDKLNKLGVIRSSEISPSLKVAVQALSAPSQVAEMEVTKKAS